MTKHPALTYHLGRRNPRRRQICLTRSLSPPIACLRLARVPGLCLAARTLRGNNDPNNDHSAVPR